jgi:multimeric flavodoxin WrbA
MPEEKATEMANVAVIYYSSTGNVHALAKGVAEGATQAGAEVRLRRVAELAPDEAINRNPACARIWMPRPTSRRRPTDSSCELADERLHQQ